MISDEKKALFKRPDDQKVNALVYLSASHRLLLRA